MGWGGESAHGRDRVGEAGLRLAQDARLRVVVALPGQLADGRVAQPDIQTRCHVGRVHVGWHAGAQDISRLVEAMHERPGAAGLRGSVVGLSSTAVASGRVFV